MEFVSKLRWVIVIVVILIVLSIAGWGLAMIARSLISSDDKETVLPTDATSLTALSATNANVVRYSTVGPVVSNSEHRSYTIEVSRNVVMMRVYSEYGQKVVAEKSYPNDERAFEYFVEALDKQRVSARVKGTTESDDYNEIGACPSGRVHIVEIDDNVRRWRTNCKDFPGTAGGNMAAIRELFSSQIPDFDAMIKGTELI